MYLFLTRSILALLNPHYLVLNGFSKAAWQLQNTSMASWRMIIKFFYRFPAALQK
jgi:hypothetical protein